MPAAPAVTLAHSLQQRHVTMISLGGIIGAGIFVGSSAAIATAPAEVLDEVRAKLKPLLGM